MNDGEVDELCQAPRTLHLDNAPEPYSPRILTFYGRIGRARYLAYTWWVTLLVMIFSGLLVNLLGSLMTKFFAAADVFSFANGALAGRSVFLVSLVSYLPNLMMARRRPHDLDHRGWFALLVFVPVLNLLLILYLLVWPGDAGSNRFGPPAAVNSLRVLVFGVGVPALLLVVFLMALFLPVLPLQGIESLWLEASPHKL